MSTWTPATKNIIYVSEVEDPDYGTTVLPGEAFKAKKGRKIIVGSTFITQITRAGTGLGPRTKAKVGLGLQLPETTLVRFSPPRLSLYIT